ncbi:N-acetylmuramoyl-L-alanine amidase [Qipengyuania sp. 6B39]|uniref:N-acetylmuramoyl-L-alanine amidase family protein n=1 Tax=Qipengyuania proteolytica TaxID=2867239 RepID=UPI001C897651|nr:N-acetylmuramoyl-L-alanine amidase [Qipengyuania proteolytica]MBX7496204.1 N-acetylmuramoyl-L-alanine amidase [Qipengyuania proteolytica]
MSSRAQILALIVLPLAILAGLMVTGMRLPLPELGRGYVQRIALPRAMNTLELPDVDGDESLPLVVIDAGHGGHDPGASGQGLVEKDLVLSLARALKDELEAQGRVRVALTRNDDRYLLHAERYEIARRLDADLFISIHADSAGDADEVVGASIYTLSNEASSEAAARFAERENASDRLNGVELGDQSDAVSTILVELSQRRTQEQSAELARLIRREGEDNLRFHPQPVRSAALKVLRAPDVPSVLFESGFITNEDEARRLSSDEGRALFAQTIARAIRIYFARQQ